MKTYRPVVAVTSHGDRLHASVGRGRVTYCGKAWSLLWGQLFNEDDQMACRACVRSMKARWRESAAVRAGLETWPGG